MGRFNRFLLILALPAILMLVVGCQKLTHKRFQLIREGVSNQLEVEKTLASPIASSPICGTGPTTTGTSPATYTSTIAAWWTRRSGSTPARASGKAPRRELTGQASPRSRRPPSALSSPDGLCQAELIPAPCGSRGGAVLPVACALPGRFCCQSKHGH